MKNFSIILSLAVVLATLSSPAVAHDVFDANGKVITNHQHVWRPTGYGQDYRQGHSVNNHLGSITIWSPNQYRGYTAGSAVRFARPTIQTGRPTADANRPAIKSQTAPTSGRGRR